MASGEKKPPKTDPFFVMPACNSSPKKSKSVLLKKSPQVGAESWPLHTSKLDFSDECFASPLSSVGMAPKPESESYLPILSVHCDDLDSVDETPAEQTHAFLENAPLDCGSGNEVFHLENPRAGGVRTPFASTPTMGHSGTPRSPSSRRLSVMENSHLHRALSVRFWNHNDSNTANEISLQNAENYFQSRTHPSMILRPQSSSPRSARSHGTRSSQMWRGDTIEETLSQSFSPFRSNARTWDPRAPTDIGPFSRSCISSRRQSIFPHTGSQAVCASGSSRELDIRPGFPTEEHHAWALTGKTGQALSGDANPLLSGSTCPEDLSMGQRVLIEKIEQLEMRVEQSERSLAQLVERFEARQDKLEKRLAELQQQTVLVNLRDGPSPPNSNSPGGTREPSRVRDA
ncbi:hypothetical protein TCDM_04934 [Trypanosoma cruzi Dm28c]|uniref:Uncharacterized protein n=1 Tax=Trypanosoma cruzi Dm28c TaxID=1416333 RepID=V5DG83_TRYCR|nr:hypothetical protein TCDM_04934 [Trypanosoma cruzi Dm28c]PBJ75744.1 hypothetical protein BCY84_10905 [Trypanosoma cruzi cruzi]PBJ80200.1 hypothetical protein BCY84_01768 [Trypanosoma cruzi cruzi]